MWIRLMHTSNRVWPGRDFALFRPNWPLDFLSTRPGYLSTQKFQRLLSCHLALSRLAASRFPDRRVRVDCRQSKMLTKKLTI